MVEPKILAEYIDQLGLNYRTTPTSYIFNCPKCGKADILYMYRVPTGRHPVGKWKCMKEGRGSKLPEYALSDLSSVPVSVIKSVLYGEKWLETAEDQLELNLELDDGFEEFEINIIPSISWKFDEYPIDHQFSKYGREYLESRGIPLDIAKKYDIHYAPVRQRVLFPVKIDGRLVGHQDRLIVDNIIWDEEEEKYKECPKIVSSDNLPNSLVPMFADNLNGSEQAIICEGPVDAIKLDLCGGGNIATMGKAVSRGQINFIRSKGVKRIYLALDPDAYDYIQRLAKEFEDLEVFTIQPQPGYKDFGAMSFEQCYEAFLQAQPVFPSQLFLYFS